VTGAYLTLPPGVERGGNSISIFPANPDTKILTYITVKIPVDDKDSASLLQDSRVLVLFYKVKKPDGSVVIGARPVTRDQIVGKEVVYQTPYFGVFQAGYVKSALSEQVEKVVGGEVFSKTEEKAADPFTWAPVSATIIGKSIKFTAAYTSASPVNYCLVRITSGSRNSDEVHRASVTAPEYTLDPAEPGVAYFAHFSCWTEQGVNTPVNSSATGTMVPNTAPLALNSSVTIAEDTVVSVPLAFDSNGGKPDTCTVKGVESLKPATCVCANAGCTANVAGDQDYFGPAALSFTLSSKGMESVVKRVAVTITAVDDAPVASDRNLGAVLANSTETIVLPYTDVEGHPATGCTTPETTNIVMITSGCSCTSGVCKVGVQYGGVGAGLIGFYVEANGKNSSKGTISFASQSTLPPSVLLLNLDFPYPGDTSAVTLLDRVKLSGTASANDYEFHLVSQPADVEASVKNSGEDGKSTGYIANPVYIRGNVPVHFDKFSFALKHKISGQWIDNASLENPAWAYTCAPGEFTSWNQLPYGPAGQLLLCSAHQMVSLFQNCRTDAAAGCDKNFRQIADIPLNAVQNIWTGGIGWGVDYVGNYDGGGHTLSHYRPDYNGFTGFTEGGGLFGRIGGSARIENLRIIDAKVDVYGAYLSEAADWGILVGRAEGEGIVIRNIEIDSSELLPHTGSSNFGALIGRAGVGVTIYDVTIAAVHILAVPGVSDVSPVGVVFGAAMQGASISRVVSPLWSPFLSVPQEAAIL
jgi:hypothetical protein